MIQSLYEPFRWWSKNSSVWLISDPHFDDSDCSIMNPNWITPEEHVARINKVVTKNDTLVCLGDCGDLDWIAKIKAGYKVLIKGNHDDKSDFTYMKKAETFTYDSGEHIIKEIYGQYKKESPNSKIQIKNIGKKYYVTVNNNLFDEVYNGQLFIKLSVKPTTFRWWDVSDHKTCILLIKLSFSKMYDIINT